VVRDYEGSEKIPNTLQGGFMKELCAHAIGVTSALGAEYADIRITDDRSQRIAVMDRSPKEITDVDTYGFGIRVLKGGAWGFASSHRVTKKEIERVAKKAFSVAEASSLLSRKKGIVLAAEPVHVDAFTTPVKIDPFSIGMDEKTAMLLRVNEAMLRVKSVVKAIAYCMANRRHQFFASQEGSFIETLITTVIADYTAFAAKGGDSQSRSMQANPLNAGWEHILSLELEENAERIAEEAVAKLHAEFPGEGKKDLVLDPTHLSLTIHESVGHPTELDRVMGYEANFAGTSFVTTEKRGTFKYGSTLVNFFADNTLPGGLATTGYDDEGVACQRWDIIKNGIFVDYSSTREVAPLIGEKRSRGSGRADAYYSFPINRIPNLCLAAGTKDISPEELIAKVKDGIYIEGRGSFSIDQRRLNFQFGGDFFYEIKNGKKRRMLRDVIYHSITPRFWGSLDGLTGKAYWEPRGVFNCGKGEPTQRAQMTNGAPYALFRNVDVKRGKK
jgi:TldD protein